MAKREDYQAAAVTIKPVHLASYFLEHRMKSKNVLSQTLRQIRRAFFNPRVPEGTQGLRWGFLLFLFTLAVAWVGSEGVSQGLMASQEAGHLRGGITWGGGAGAVLVLPLEKWAVGRLYR